MFKKIILLLLAAMMCFSVLAACGGDAEISDAGNESENAPESKEESKEPEVIMPEYWGFNNYDRVNITGAPDEVTSYPTTIEKISDSKYAIYSELDVGKITITLEERPWGCFNLWAWSLKDKSGKTHVFAGGSTDFEYVHRPITPQGSVVWSGGNHGNEAFISIDFYNAETGEKIELEKGKPISTNGIHVIEKTKLLWFPDANSDSIGDYNNKNMTYTEDDVYAEMTRKYTFTGPQIKLNVDYKYVKNGQQNRSYTCMMPIDKKYGLWCEMYNEKGELLKTIETLKVGKADYSGPSNSGNSACRAVVYGYVDPRYQLDVRVNTIEDSLDKYKGDFKTAFWDMNTSSNKLYFTRFTNNAKKSFKAGDEYHTECVWLFKYVEDAVAPEISEPEKEEYEKFEDVTFDGKNVASGKSYTLSGLLGTGYGNYTANLTDGKATDKLTYDNNWFSFFNSASLKPEELNVENGIGFAIIDLGKETEIKGVRAHICNGGTAGINAPYYAKVYISNDGKNFEEAGEMKIAEDPGAIYWTGTEIKDKSARYVKFEFKPNGLFVFLNELEVYEK